MTNAEIIWRYFENKNFNPYAIAAIMGNMDVESGLQPNNLQNEYNASLSMSDEQYTRAVDNDTYTNFIYDSAGYGLVQWTYWSLKKELYDLCKSRKKSIADIECQLDCLYKQLSDINLLNSLNSATSIKEASNLFLMKFEKPYDQSQQAQNVRANCGQKYYNQFGGKSKMKYTNNNPPMVCMQTNSRCYKNTHKMQVKGVLWHSTGANNPTLKRYVQPLETDANYSVLISKIGKNPYSNDYNHAELSSGLNAFIGKLANGQVATVQAMPWDYAPWGCGGECNNGWVQFELCEDSLTDRSYFEEIYKEACELTAYLCKLYNLDPKGIVNAYGKQVPVILCHADSYKLGLGSNHSDVYNWFDRYNKTMDDVRNDVVKILGSLDFTPQGNIIQRGDCGENVKELQKKLISLGYSCGNCGADGDFGNDTYNAVIKFQNDNKLTPNGIVDESMLKLLNSEPKEQDVEQIYRIRKTWEDVKSQKGAYKSLESAKKQCDKVGAEYSVFDSNGNIVYRPEEKKEEIKSEPNKTISAQDVIAIAKAEVGYYEKGTNSQLDEKAANAGAGNYTKYSRDLFAKGYYGGSNKQGLPWCDVFVDWCFLKACDDDAKKAQELQCQSGSGGAVCSYSAQYYKNAGQWLDTPQEGAQIFFYYDGAINHTGIVERIDGSNIYVIEGNSSDKVVRRFYALNNSSIAGYGIPKYGEISNITQQNTFTPYIVRVTANALNVRALPDINSKVNTVITKNGAYTIVKEKGEWGKLKSGAGWINLSYVQKI